MRRLSLALVAASALFAGCYPAPYPSYPVTVASPPNFDQCWAAAIGAAEDAGVQVTLADRYTGRITGLKGNANVTIDLKMQPNNTLKVVFSAPDSTEQNPTLQDRWLGAYNRRMGR